MPGRHDGLALQYDDEGAWQHGAVTVVRALFGCFAHWLVSWRIRACIGRAHALNKEACEFVPAPLYSSNALYSRANFR